MPRIIGTNGNDVLFGTFDIANADDTINGRGGDDFIFGGDGIDRLYGDDGDDTLEDTGGGFLFGGAGNDTLVSASFEADELHGGSGTDQAKILRMWATVDYKFTLDWADDSPQTLADGTVLSDIERINFFLGSGNDTVIMVLSPGMSGWSNVNFGGGINSTVIDASELTADLILESRYGTFGNFWAEVVGTDIVYAGDGVSHLEVRGGSGNDRMTALPGNDTIFGNEGFDTLDGLDGNDLLSGGAGTDWLDGGVGTDTMLGGAGDDTYIVDSPTDRVFETTTTGSGIDAGGIDTVQSEVTFNLDASAGARFVENLLLTGTANLNGTGNALANRLTGNAGNNTLNGGLGNDIMLGGAGNDTYIVDASGDRVFETTATNTAVDAGGVDTVRSSVTFNLDASAGARFVENLLLTGTANLNGTGNALANRLTGNAGNNTLNGGLGRDTMIGGAGNDTFVFNTALGAGNVDRITDFSVPDDSLRLNDAVFVGLATGDLAATAFAANRTGRATDALDRIIYERDTGRLYFDADGSGEGARVHFATLSAGLTLTSADFFVF